MKIKVLALIALATFPFIVNAQLGKFANKIKSKVNQRVDNKINTGIDKTLDKAESTVKPGPSENSTTGSNSSAATGSRETTGQVSTYSKYDFVPGEKVLYAEDFSQDVIGELPLNWNTNGKGVVVNLNNASGQWIRMSQNSTYLTSNKQEFGKNFTIEFDIVMQLTNTGHTFPLFTFGMLATGEKETTDNKFLEYPSLFQNAEILIRPSTNNSSWSSIKTNVERNEFASAKDQSVANLEKYYHKVTHVAVQVQESRLRMWVNAEKVYDIPKIIPAAHIFNQLYFKMHSSGYKDEQVGFMISNIKIATGIPDNRHKFIEEGKFSTSGIQFDVNTATIKPESNGVLNEMGNILKKHADIKVLINGHTDSDGDDKSNLALSEKRAAAVKQYLVENFGLDESRITTVGKGESQPIADNKTKEGKAQNRRVEFIKQ